MSRESEDCMDGPERQLRISTLGAIGLATVMAASGCTTNGSGHEEGSDVRTVTQQASTTSKVLVNLLGYLPDANKVAVVVASGTSGTWQVLDSSGSPISGASGSTTVKSADTNSGEAVHHADFSSFKAPGSGYKLQVTIGGVAHESESFDINANLYAAKKLPKAIMKVVHYARAGMDTQAFPEFGVAARAAGHTGDTSLTGYGTWCDGCSFDVDGGWYDAGDHGKYMESHTAATWYFLNTWERLKDETDTAGTSLSNWALDNGVASEGASIPEFIHEMVWGTRWVAGAMNDPFTHKSAPTRADLVANKCTSAGWPPYPSEYADDPTTRNCMGPSTSATHSAARNAAHLARVLKDYGTASTAIDLDGATTASAVASKFWQVAKEAFGRASGEHPGYSSYTGAGASDLSKSDLSFASGESPGHNVGSGPYQDDDMEDDHYTAAVELYLTACAYNDADAVSMYKSIVTSHPNYKKVPSVPDWGTEGDLGDSADEETAMGSLSLLFAHDQYCSGTEALPSADLAAIESNLTALADDLISNMDSQNYSYAPAGDGGQVVWGSNSAQAGAGTILAAAFQATGDKDYLKASYRAMDYLLGTNPMRVSYFTGFGQKSGHPVAGCCNVEAVHHRVYNAGGQGVPRGVLVGGPLNIQENLNPTQKDPTTPKSGAALKRFANTSGDGGSSWESEEKAINWDAAGFAHAWALQALSDNISESCSSAADCNDGSACTTDACVAGACQNTPVDCGDADSCTVDSCQDNGDGTYACVNANTCCTGSADCNDGDSCTDNVCNGDGSCSNPLNGSCVSGDIAALVKSGADDGDNTIQAHLKIKNNGSSSVDLSDYEVRYYFTNDSSGTMVAHCDWASIGCSNVSTTFHATTAGSGADTYAKVTFASGSVSAGTDSGELQVRFTASNWSNFDETDDHSFQDSSSSFTENSNVAIFQSGTRVYGVLPGTGDGETSGCSSDADCDDGNECTIDTCNADGTCSQASPSCDDGNDCTTNSCDPAIGCTTTNNNLGCADDGNDCTDDVCNGGTCTHPDNGECNYCTSDADCDDSNACTVGVCNTTTNECENTTLNCNDGNACTSDSCDPASGCVNANLANGSPCADDGDNCTNDVCSSGTCTHPDNNVCECEVNADCNDNDECTDDVCSGNMCTNTTIDGCGDTGGTGGSTGGGDGPCDGLCNSPAAHTSQSFQSGDLGPAAACQEFVGTLSGGNCGNMDGRSFSVNGEVVSCAGNFTPPAKRNGGYCFQAAAGGVGWAYYGHW